VGMLSIGGIGAILALGLELLERALVKGEQ